MGVCACADDGERGAGWAGGDTGSFILLRGVEQGHSQVLELGGWVGVRLGVPCARWSAVRRGKGEKQGAGNERRRGRTDGWLDGG